MRLQDRQRTAALGVAEAILPSGERFAGANAETIDRLERLLGASGPNAVRGYGRLLDFVEYSTALTRGRRFSRLPRAQREALIRRWSGGGSVRRAGLLSLTFPLRSAHFNDPAFFEAMGAQYRFESAPESQPWSSQVQRAAALSSDTIECDVVVIGTGAGGAVVAKELAEAGLAVAMVEEGEYHRRSDFSGRPMDAMRRLYRSAPESTSLGNAVIPIPLGRCVGGTTTINSGTCFRTPNAVLRRWQREFGLAMTPDEMAPYFERVERVLGVAEAKAKYVGAVGEVVARGCDALGWSHFPLRRNAPDCDGRGVCVFGCPTDAKRSTNVSYVPLALTSGALLLTGFRADRVLVDRGRAVGIEGSVLGSGRRLSVRAQAVVVACGALGTPGFLARQGLLKRSRQLGRNLTIHPAVGVSALFDERIRGFDSIPQGYCVDEFHDEGILMEGASVPLDLGATVLDVVGGELMELMEAYDRLATFGAMVSERRGGGRVITAGGRSFIYYSIAKDVRAKLQRALVLLGEIFFAAGAKRVYTGLRGAGGIGTPEALRAMGRRKVRAADLRVSAFHPLGTCRIGAERGNAVCDENHETFEIPGLYVCDGSSVPTSPEVNPQVTIMALATRAADRLAERLL